MKLLYIGHDDNLLDELRGQAQLLGPDLQVLKVTSIDLAMDQLFYNGPISVVIIDADLGNEHGRNIAKGLVEASGERPIIFVGTNEQIEGLDNVTDICESFTIQKLIHPVDQKDFHSKLRICFEWIEKENFNQTVVTLDRSEYIPLKIKVFSLFKSLPYDIYLELSQNKFLKVFSKGQRYTHNDLRNFSRKGIRYLYLAKDDHLKFLDDALDIFEKSLSKRSNPIQAMTSLVKSVDIFHEYLLTVGVSEDLEKVILKWIKTCEAVGEHYESTSKMILDFPLKSNTIGIRTTLAGLLAIKINQQQGWLSDLSMRKLGLASILHEIGLVKHGEKSFQAIIKGIEIDDDYDYEQYKDHIRKAVELSHLFKNIPETDFIISQHHELPSGKGFPRGINHSKITPICGCFIIATQFATNLSINGFESKKQVVDSFDQICINLMMANFRPMMNSLRQSI